MNGGDSPCGSDGSGWGFGSPAAVDWSVCTPCAKPFDPGPSQLSSSEFSSQQLPGSVGSGGSGWGVVFQQTPVGAGDMDLARSKSPRSFADSTNFERDVETNLLCQIINVVQTEHEEIAAFETEDSGDFDDLLAADEEAADWRARRSSADSLQNDKTDDLTEGDDDEEDDEQEEDDEDDDDIFDLSNDKNEVVPFKFNELSEGSSQAAGGEAKSQRDVQSKARSHLSSANQCHSTFSCGCSLALARGSQSCLSQFSPDQCKTASTETFGLSDAETGIFSCTANSVAEELHKHMWALAVEKKCIDSHGRTHDIPVWKYGGKTICHAAWKQLRGGSQWSHRIRYGMVLRGHDPWSEKAVCRATMHQAVRKCRTVESEARQEFAIQWWLPLIATAEFKPNEQKIQYRGPSDRFLFDKVYSPAAEQAGLALKRTQWRATRKLALRRVEDTLEGAKPGSLKFGRAAKHSNFPECKSCQTLRRAWIRLEADKAPLNVRKRALDELVSHMEGYKLDREVSKELRYAASVTDADDLYENGEISMHQ